LEKNKNFWAELTACFPPSGANSTFKRDVVRRERGERKRGGSERHYIWRRRESNKSYLLVLTVPRQ
jgi:hypothetical protein